MRLYGDGRHRQLQVPYEDRQLVVRFQGGDGSPLVYVDGIGDDIPDALVDVLIMAPGSGIHKGGDAPVDIEHQRRIEEKAAADAAANGAGRESQEETNKKTAAGQPQFEWPSDEQTKAQLVTQGVTLGLSEDEIGKLKKDELLHTVRVKLAGELPELAEANGFQP